MPKKARIETTDTNLSTRISELRKQRRWTLEQLSAASGVSRSMLSEIERGRANPTLAVAMRIAEAFSLTLDQLVWDANTPRGIHIVRADDESHVYRADDECLIRTLSPLHLEKDIEFYQVQLHPGAELRSAPHFRGCREIVTVSSGSCHLTAGKHEENLNIGDSACYPADQPHCLRNLSQNSPLLLYLIVIYRS